MNRAMQINLGGMYFHIDEDAYNLLNEYTSSLREYFSKEGDSSKEIIDDIEQRMAELLNAGISEKKQVITLKDINEAIKILGKIEDFEFEKTGNGENYTEEPETSNRKAYRKLYRDPDNSILGGVCSGLAAYFNFEPWLVRFVFIILLFINVIIPPFFSLFGIGVLLYLILWIVVPKARNTAQKLEMRGEQVTVQNIKRTINKEYKKVKSSVEGFGNSEGYRKTRDTAEEIMHAIGKFILVFLKIIVYFIGLAFLIVGILLLVGVSTAVITGNRWIHRFDWPDIYFPNLSDFFTDPASITIVAACLVILLAIPVISLIVWGIKLLTNVRGSNRVLQASAVTLWVIALIVLIAVVFTESNAFAFQASSSDNERLKSGKFSTLYLEIEDKNGIMEGITIYSIFDHDIYYDKRKEKILGKPSLSISESENNYFELVVNKKMRNITMKNADEYLETIEYNWVQKDSVLIFDNYFSMDKDNKWRFAEVELILKIPRNKKINISKSMNNIQAFFWVNESAGIWEAYNKTLIMTDSGLKFYTEE